MKNLKIDLNSILMIIIIILILKPMFFPQNTRHLDNYNEIRESIIREDSLKTLYEGRYEKLVNDYNSEKSLADSLKKSNSKLYKEIKTSKSRIISLTNALVSFKNVPVREVVIHDTIKPNTDYKFYYPNEESKFATHKLNFNSDFTKAKESWEFGEIPIDVVITETKEGIYKADFSGSDFIKLNDFTVNSIPRIKPKKYSWSYGAGIWSDNSQWGVDLYGGFRINNFNTLLRVQPRKDFLNDSQIGVSIIYSPVK